MYFIVQTVNIR